MAFAQLQLRVQNGFDSWRELVNPQRFRVLQQRPAYFFEAKNMKQQISFRVNGDSHSLETQPNRLLLDCLRDDLKITGPKEGCSVGVCGACTVLVNGRLVSACLELAVRCDGADITTIEGLGTPDNLHPIQQAFIDQGGFQCGICTPGMVLTTKALLDQNPEPSDDQIKAWMMGNLCRCTGYYKIADSVKAAALAYSPTSNPNPSER